MGALRLLPPADVLVIVSWGVVASSGVEVVSSLTAAVGGDADEVETLPGVLTAAAARVLGADAASLSLLSLELRVPLGGSSAEAAIAERVQFTVGEGPCLQVFVEGRPIAHDLDAMTARWPHFTRELVTTTSYRSVASAPLPMRADGGGGALDLYCRDPDGAGRIDLADAQVTAEWIVTQLVGAVPRMALAGPDEVSQVPWLATRTPRRRMEVWVAIGLLVDRLTVDTADALALLRGFAHSHETDVDTVAADLTSGRLAADRLRP